MHGGPQEGEIVKISYVNCEGRREGMRDGNMRDQDELGERRRAMKQVS